MTDLPTKYTESGHRLALTAFWAVIGSVGAYFVWIVLSGLWKLFTEGYAGFLPQ